MNPDAELMYRELHTAYNHGLISKEQAASMWKMYNKPLEQVTYNFPVSKPIVGYFNFNTGESMSQEEFERAENEFVLRGAL